MNKFHMPHFPHAKAVVAAGVSAAVIGSAAVAYAATGSSSPPPAAQANARAGASAHHRAAHHRAPWRQLRGLVIGEVTSFSSTGGAASVGTITVLTPDGKAITANLAKHARVLAYQGRGVKPTKETVSALGAKTDEMVAVRVVARRAHTASTSTASPSTSTRTLYAPLIVDLGFATSSSTSGS